MANNRKVLPIRRLDDDKPRKARSVPEKHGLMNPNFEYTPAAATNVQNTWRKYGWKPLEQK